MSEASLQASRSRRRALTLLAAALLLAHALLAERLASWLASAAQESGMPPRLQAVFVRELRPVEPPAARAMAALPAPRLAAPRRIAPAASPAVAASAASPAISASNARSATRRQAGHEAWLAASSEALPDAADRAPLAPVEDKPLLEPQQAQAMLAGASAPGLGASAPAMAELAAAASAAAPTTGEAPSLPAEAASPSAEAASTSRRPSGFAWPPSTRLSYTLIGDVRGEVRGEAQVEWVREGSRYQVHLDVLIGPGFAPAARRRITSDGELTPHGLAPRRYDESTRVAFGGTQRLTMHFDEVGVTLADGSRTDTLPALQDSASQFVQLTYLFLTGTERLEAGRQVEVPLALPRHVEVLAYDVVGEEQLHTPFGALAAWHLRPRRPPRRGTLAVEAWFAPSLQYLPVRIVIRQGGEHYIDLMIERLPQQALSPQGGSPESAAGPVQEETGAALSR